MPVCHAVQHAHQKGIIHRDLKPSNILVAEYDERPVPKIIDFGVAKAIQQRLTERTVFTQLGQVVGTIDYMSPEQAKLNELDIDTRTDVYSLGVLLYELLTGETPFDRERLRSAAFDELLRIIREEDPPKPSLRLSSSESLPSIAGNRQIEPKKLSTLVRGELDWIVMKALEKDRSRRYETANGFAADIERYLSDEPVLACPPSAAYRLRKVVRRNKGPVLAVGLVLLALVAGIIGTTCGLVQARTATEAERKAREAETTERLRAEEKEALAKQQEALAQKQKELADQEKAKAVRLQGLAEDRERSTRRHLYAAHMNVALQAWEDGHVEWASALLDKHLPAPGAEDLRSFDWYYLWRLCHSERLCLLHTGCVWQVRFSPDGNKLATAGWSACLYDATTGQILEEFKRVRMARSVAFSPDGKLLAVGYADGGVDLRDTTNWQVQAELERQTCGVHAMAFSPDSRWLATANGPTFDEQADSAVKVWDLATRKVAMTRIQPKSMVTAVDFSPDGRMLAASWGSGEGSGGVSLWDCATWKERVIHPEWKSGGVRFCPDGKTLAADFDGLTLLDPATGEERLRIHKPGEWCMAFSPDGKTVATGGMDQVVRLWDVATGQERRVLKGNVQWIFDVAFSPDGRTVASASRDGAVRLWDLTAEAAEEVLPGVPGARLVAFSSDGRTVAAAGADGSIRLLDMATSRQTTIFLPPGTITAMALAGEGKSLAVATRGPGKPANIMLLPTEDKPGSLVAISRAMASPLDPSRAKAELPPGEVLFMDFEADTVAQCGQLVYVRDLSGSNNHGVGRQVAYTAEGKVGGGLACQGGAIHLRRGVLANLPEYTVAGWVYRAANGGGLRVYSQYRSGGIVYELAAVNGDYIVLGAWHKDVAGNWMHATTPPGSVPHDQWFFLAVRFNEAAEGKENLTVTIDDKSYHLPFQRVAYEDPADVGQLGGGNKAAGVLDEVVIYPRALSDAEIDGLYRRGLKGGMARGAPAAPSSPAEPFRTLEDPSGASCSLLAFSADGRLLAGAAGREVRLWDVPSGKLRGTLADHFSNIQSLAFSPDGKRLAVGTRELPQPRVGRAGVGRTDYECGEVRVWDVPSQRSEVAFRWTLNNPGVAFSRDGKLLAAAGSNHLEGPGGGQARVWEVGTWREVVTLAGHRSTVSSVAFSSDGKLLVTAGEDGAVRLWDTTTWQERLLLKWPDQPISGVSLSADTSILVASSRDSVRVWRGAGQADVSQYIKDAAYRTWTSWMDRAALHDPSSEWEGMVADYSQAIQVKPDEPLAWHLRAHAKEGGGHCESALADFTEAIRLDPRDPVVHYCRGKLYCQEHAFDRAIADFTEVIRLDPGYAPAYLNRGQVSIEKGDIDKAIADLSKATQLDPTDAKVWYRRALACLAGARGEQYRKDCAEMLKRFGQTDSPDQAHWVAGTCVLAPDATDDWPRVVALAELAAKSDPKSFAYLNTLGAALYREGRFGEAVTRLEEADRLVKDSSEDSVSSPACTWYFLAMAHHRLGHTEEPKQWLDKALQEHEQATKPLPWNRRLTLKLLREEAEALLGSAVKPEPEPGKSEKAK